MTEATTTLTRAGDHPLNHNLREERAPVWQLGRIQMLQCHRPI